MTLTRLMCAGTIISWSDLHRNGFEWVVPALPSVPKEIYLFKPNGTVRGVHAVGVRHVAGAVPESTKVIVSTVFVPRVLIFVKCCELHVVVSCQTVPWRKKKRSMLPAEVKDQNCSDNIATGQNNTLEKCTYKPRWAGVHKHFVRKTKGFSRLCTCSVHSNLKKICKKTIPTCVITDGVLKILAFLY